MYNQCITNIYNLKLVYEAGANGLEGVVSNRSKNLKFTHGPGATVRIQC